MSRELDAIKDWPLRAQEARYNVNHLAYQCGVSVRQLHRYFEARQQTTPHKWLHEMRMQRAAALIAAEAPVKLAAATLGYRDAAHFSHDFKNYFGLTPTAYLRNPNQSSPKLKSPTSPARNGNVLAWLLASCSASKWLAMKTAVHAVCWSVFVD